MGFDLGPPPAPARLPSRIARADHEIVQRLGERFLEWATHALICADVACLRCDEALFERPRPPDLRPGRVLVDL